MVSRVASISCPRHAWWFEHMAFCGARLVGPADARKRVDPPVATPLLPKVVTVFRRRVSTWESEALVHVEILRAMLDSLTELKSSIDRSDPSASAVVLDNASQVTTRSGVWLTEWKNRCIDKGVTEAAAFEAYATCLPALAHCVDVYQWSLRILAISRAVDSGDGELAARGINTAARGGTLHTSLSRRRTNAPVERSPNDAGGIGNTECPNEAARCIRGRHS